MQYGTILLSKVIDANDPSALTRYGITERDFPTQSERAVFRFVRDYAEQNRGEAPSYATVAVEVPDFAEWYSPQVGEPYEYLTKQIKGHAAKQWLVDLINGREGERDSWLERTLNEVSDGVEVLNLLQEKTEQAIMNTNTRSKIGTNVKTDGDKFKAEYERRKSGESFRIWKSKFDFINEQVGGYVSSNVYTVYGKSGRGKSVITLEEALESAMQGANVLIWAMEMGWFEVLVRIYVSLSARSGQTVTNISGLDMAAGFDSTELRYGKLSEDFEAAFDQFLANLNELVPGNITVRGVDDDDFYVRNLQTLEADILATKADVVVVDPFYYLDYERNTSKTTGGDAANTSMKLRRLAGRTKTVIFAITQADETNQEEDDDGNRELELPQRKDVKKTKALLEDAYLLIGVDTDYKQGRGLIGLNKGRDGGEGIIGEIIYHPQVGIVKQPPSGLDAATHFNF